MTFAPGQVITTEEWKRRHRTHTVTTHVEQVSIKRLHWLICGECHVRHLVKMETVEDGPEGSQ